MEESCKCSHITTQNNINRNGFVIAFSITTISTFCIFTTRNCMLYYSYHRVWSEKIVLTFLWACQIQPVSYQFCMSFIQVVYFHVGRLDVSYEFRRFRTSFVIQFFKSDCCSITKYNSLAPSNKNHFSIFDFQWDHINNAEQIILDSINEINQSLFLLMTCGWKWNFCLVLN